MSMRTTSALATDSDYEDAIEPIGSATILEIERPLIAADLVHRARILLGVRRLREFTFGDDADIFGEPSWDILLDLFIGQQEARETSVSMLGGYITPSATVLRHAKVLQERGLVTRTPDRCDRRRHLMGLTPRGVELIRRILVRAEVEGPRSPTLDDGVDR